MLNSQRGRLNPGEHLEYLLWHQSKGLRIIHPNGEEETPHHNSTTGCRFLLITDQRLCYLAGLENRDVQQSFGYDQLTDVEVTDNTFTFWITFTTTDGTKYRFAETGTHWEDVEPAAVYIQEQIEKKHDKLNSNLRQQMRDAFEHGEYPATGLMDVAPALPKGPATTFQAGEFSVTAENLCWFIIFTSNMEFPYRTVDEFVDGILQELATHGYISSSDTHHSTDQSPGNGSDRSGQGTSDTEVYRPEDDRAGPGNAGTDQQPTGRMTGQARSMNHASATRVGRNSTERFEHQIDRMNYYPPVHTVSYPQQEVREMSLPAEWTVNLPAEPGNIQFHDAADVMTVAFADPSDGPVLAILSPADGTEQARIPTTGLIGSVTYDESTGLVFATTVSYSVHAIDPLAGKERWQASAEGVVNVSEDVAVLKAGADLFGYDPENGTQQWKATLPDDPYGGPGELRSGSLLKSVGEYEDKGLVSISVDTGVEEWYYRPGDAYRWVVTEDGIFAGFHKDTERENTLVRVFG